MRLFSRRAIAQRDDFRTFRFRANCRLATGKKASVLISIDFLLPKLTSLEQIYLILSIGKFSNQKTSFVCFACSFCSFSGNWKLEKFKSNCSLKPKKRFASLKWSKLSKRLQISQARRIYWISVTFIAFCVFFCDFCFGLLSIRVPNLSFAVFFQLWYHSSFKINCLLCFFLPKCF